MEKSLDTPYVHYFLQGDLLTGTYKKSSRITLEIAKEIVKERLDFTGNQPVAVLIYNEGVKTVDKKARDYFTSDEGVQHLVAAAYVVENKFSSFIANFFVAITKTKIPVRIFSNKQAALKWLAQFRK